MLMRAAVLHSISDMRVEKKDCVGLLNLNPEGKVKPFDAANKVFFMTGPLTGRLIN